MTEVQLSGSIVTLIFPDPPWVTDSSQSPQPLLGMKNCGMKGLPVPPCVFARIGGFCHTVLHDVGPSHNKWQMFQKLPHPPVEIELKFDTIAEILLPVLGFSPFFDGSKYLRSF